MSFADLSISGSPTPRAYSRRAVTARHQSVKKTVHNPVHQLPNEGGAIVTKEQLALARKLTYFEEQVNEGRREMNKKTKNKLDNLVKRKDEGNKRTKVPLLKLDMLKGQHNSKPDYHIMSGADTSRSVMSWGAQSVRHSPPPGVNKIEAVQLDSDQQEVKGKKPDRTEQNKESPVGEFELLVQTGGSEQYATDEEMIKRTRQEAAVEERMLQDLTLPESIDQVPNSYTLRTPWATSDSERADFYALNEIPRVKRLDYSLHATSKEFTYTHLKDRGIEKRLKFNVRIISRCGKDSLRNLVGFLFTSDNSITVYEYREMGKRYSAVPLFPRAVYRHQHGRWAGNPYTLRDMKIGTTLHFSTTNNPSLPPSITRSPLALLRISAVSRHNVMELLYDDCKLEERTKKEEMLTDNIPKEEIVRLQRIKEIQDHIKQQLRKRPVRSLVGLGHYFALHDRDKDGYWRADELQAVLRTFRIQLSSQDFQTLWLHLDEDGSGFIDVGEFLRGMLGELSEARVGLVRRAWCRMDPSRSGDVSYVTIQQFYNPVLSLDPDADDDITRGELLDEFIQCFSAGPLVERVTYCEFLDYYTAVSLSEDDDVIFVHFMKTCWNI